MARLAHNALDTRRVPKLTDALAKSLPAPAVGEVNTGYWIYWDASEEYFGLQVYESGKRSWVLQCYRPDRKQVRRVLGNANTSAPDYMKLTKAVAEKKRVKLEIDNGIDKVDDKKQARLKEQAQQSEVAMQLEEDSMTLAVAMRGFVEKQTRTVQSKDVPLKTRTKMEYLAMVSAGKFHARTGDPRPDGELYPLANIPIKKITGVDIRNLYEQMKLRGKDGRINRRSSYALTALKSVFKFKGVQLPDDPFAKELPKEDRLKLDQSGVAKNPIKRAYRGKWWYYAGIAGDSASGIGGSKESADLIRFQLLTGLRPHETIGDQYDNPPLLVGDVDLVAKTISRKDTKNRQNHTVYLSRQALELCKQHMAGKKKDDRLFGVKIARKTIMLVNKAAGLPENAHSLKDMRSTFASIARKFVDEHVLKLMMNHSLGNNVTSKNYLDEDIEDELIEGWQAVADHLDEEAKPFATQAPPEAVEDPLGTVADVIDLMAEVADATHSFDPVPMVQEEKPRKRTAKKAPVKIDPVQPEGFQRAQLALF